MKCIIVLGVFLLAMTAESKTITQSVYGKYKKKTDIFAKAQRDCLAKVKNDVKNLRSSLSVEILAVLPEAKSYLALCELKNTENAQIAKLNRDRK